MRWPGPVTKTKTESTPAGLRVPAARRAREPSCAEETWATCLLIRNLSNSASNSSLSGSSFDAPTCAQLHH